MGTEPYLILFNIIKEKKGKIMHDEENLKIYLKKLEELAYERLRERNITPLEAIREALNYIEGEMQGYRLFLVYYKLRHHRIPVLNMFYNPWR